MLNFLSRLHMEIEILVFINLDMIYQNVFNIFTAQPYFMKPNKT